MLPYQRYTAEFIGTLLLVLVGVGSALIAGSQIGLLGISLTFGMTITALIYTLGPVSGCHINPAITLGLFLIKRLKGKHVISYIIAQCLGAVAGAYILFHIVSGKVGFDVMAGFGCTGFGEHSPQHYSMFAAGFWIKSRCMLIK